MPEVPQQHGPPGLVQQPIAVVWPWLIADLAEASLPVDSIPPVARTAIQMIRSRERSTVILAPQSVDCPFCHHRTIIHRWRDEAISFTP